MPKQIKFNLIVDKKPIRDIEDLVENFNVEDILEAFQNGSLKRWLDVRDLTKEAAGIEKIKGGAVEKARELCRIFHADCTEEQLAQAAYSFEFRQKDQAKLEQLESVKNQRDEIIRSYHDGYDKLLSEMEIHYDDYPFLKTAVIQIYKEYLGLFKLDVVNFYWRFVFDHPLVIFTVLANLEMRTLLTKIISEQEIFEHLTNMENYNDHLINLYKDKSAIPFLAQCNTMEELAEIQSKYLYVFVFGRPTPISPFGQILNKAISYYSDESIKSMQPTRDLMPPFIYAGKGFLAYPSHVKSFSGVTDGYWKDVEGKGNWMIIQIYKDNFVRSLGKNGEEFKDEDVNGKFPILKGGIDYKSNNSSAKLIYMEV